VLPYHEILLVKLYSAKKEIIKWDFHVMVIKRNYAPSPPKGDEWCQKYVLRWNATSGLVHLNEAAFSRNEAALSRNTSTGSLSLEPAEDEGDEEQAKESSVILSVMRSPKGLGIPPS